MATLDSILTRVRYKARDESEIELTDTLALSFANGILQTIHDHLVSVESSLVYDSTTVTLVDGTAEYAVNSGNHDGILTHGVWLTDDQDLLPQVNETDLISLGYDPTDTGTPERWYLNADNQIGFHPIPDSDCAGDTVTVLYWSPLTELTAVGDTVPWFGIWDRVVEYWLLFDFLERRESDNTRIASLLDQYWNLAMQSVYSRGVRHYAPQGAMFDAEGV